MHPLIAHCHLGLGKLYRHAGDGVKAQGHLTTATTMYREMDMQFWLEQGRLEAERLAAELQPPSPAQRPGLPARLPRQSSRPP